MVPQPRPVQSPGCSRRLTASLGCLQRASAVTISSIRRAKLPTVARQTASLPTTTATRVAGKRGGNVWICCDVGLGCHTLARLEQGEPCCLLLGRGACTGQSQHAREARCSTSALHPGCMPAAGITADLPAVVKDAMACARFLLTRPPAANSDPPRCVGQPGMAGSGAGGRAGRPQARAGALAASGCGCLVLAGNRLGCG